MSLDLWIEPETCEHCGHTPEREVVNITYNLAPMWYAIFPEATRMIEIEGMLSGVACVELLIAREALWSDPGKFDKLNPKNGWGHYKDFICAIERLIELCQKHPDGIWRADR